MIGFTFSSLFELLSGLKYETPIPRYRNWDVLRYVMSTIDNPRI